MKRNMNYCIRSLLLFLLLGSRSRSFFVRAAHCECGTIARRRWIASASVAFALISSPSPSPQPSLLHLRSTDGSVGFDAMEKKVPNNFAAEKMSERNVITSATRCRRYTIKIAVSNGERRTGNFEGIKRNKQTNNYINSVISVIITLFAHNVVAHGNDSFFFLPCESGEKFFFYDYFRFGH